MNYRLWYVLFLINLTLSCLSQKLTRKQPVHTVHVYFSPNHPANIIKPEEVIGAAFDGHAKGDNDRILSSQNITAMRSVGLKPLSYRLRTELAGEVWHWNPVGSWSEGKAMQGYWISDDHLNNSIQVSNGYRLPRRGNTHDQANDDDYSRLDDGDTSTFWKSNPYLDAYFTKEDNILHPQWVIVDLGKSMDVNAIKIKWSNPYALSYQVEYAFDIGKEYFEPFNPGLWHKFSNGNVINNKGENKIVKVANKAIRARFIKVSMFESSCSFINRGHDVRDSLGFAIKEIEVGFIDYSNIFHDWIHHTRNNKTQSIIHVSSTDPWHTAGDIDANTEQAGIDRFFSSGLMDSSTSVMMPVGLLYDTPENMKSLIRYMLAKNYPVKELEMGEEPEGQLVNPVDYASLYVQWASEIKLIAPHLKFGGPGFAALAFTEDDAYTFSERQWTKMFIGYLKEHNSLNSFNFFSTEWYPFDDICAPAAPQLAIGPQMLRTALKDYQQHILPPGIPVYLTEYGYSAYSGRAEVEIEGALMYADILGQFLTLGGRKSFLYGYEPAFLDQTKNCDWGNNMLFGMDDSGRIIYRTAAYYGVQLMTQKWAAPSDSAIKIYPAGCSLMNKAQLPLISAYAILRPDNKWSLAIINKDPAASHDIKIRIRNKDSGIDTDLHFPVQSFQYSPLQYKWANEEGEGHPTLALPPVTTTLRKGAPISLPPYSLTIIRE